jgi:hypothetical protein
MQLTFQIMLNWLPLLMQARGRPKNEVAYAQTGFNLGGAAALLMGFLLDHRARLPRIVAAAMALPAVLAPPRERTAGKRLARRPAAFSLAAEFCRFR